MGHINIVILAIMSFNGRKKGVFFLAGGQFLKTSFTLFVLGGTDI